MSAPRRRPVIAVVDDDQGVRESLALLLDSADYEVRAFAAAAALLASDDLSQIDCLISDVAMPEMDGMALARAVQVAQPGLPIILITGRPDVFRQTVLVQPDSHRVFSKPFSGQDLLAAIREELQHGSERVRRP